ncbi:IS110 family transposase [Betaproteobacteria bacterium]|nr:IS110 family transposase [Betaproteobacteria bacterium]
MARALEERRYVGIDLGKRTYTLAVINEQGKVALSSGETSPEGRQALYKKLVPTDRVAIEAGNLAFEMAKEMMARVGSEVVVLNASKLALIYGSMKKTDKEDALKLAKLVQRYEASELPVVAVPSDREMYRRKLLAAYKRAKRDRTQSVNQLHKLFVQMGITTVVKKDLAKKAKRDEMAKLLQGLEREEGKYVLARIDLSERRIAELQAGMDKEAEGDGQIQILQTIPGVGPLTAFAFVSYVDVRRFDNAAQVSNYFGLVPKVDISCTIVKYGRITKRGNGYVRSLLVQAAWSTVRNKKGGALRERFEDTKGSVGKKKTIVGIARRLAGLMYTMLKNGTEYEPRRYKGGKAASVERLAEAAVA